jgi:hypothetical protein
MERITFVVLPRSESTDRLFVDLLLFREYCDWNNEYFRDSPWAETLRECVLTYWMSGVIIAPEISMKVRDVDPFD